MLGRYPNLYNAGLSDPRVLNQIALKERNYKE